MFQLGRDRHSYPKIQLPAVGPTSTSNTILIDGFMAFGNFLGGNIQTLHRLAQSTRVVPQKRRIPSNMTPAFPSARALSILGPFCGNIDRKHLLQNTGSVGYLMRIPVAVQAFACAAPQAFRQCGRIRAMDKFYPLNVSDLPASAQFSWHLLRSCFMAWFRFPGFLCGRFRACAFFLISVGDEST